MGPGAKAFFLFVTEDGTISGWNPTVNPDAVIVKNRAGKTIYKGCAITQGSSGPKFYAINLQSAGWRCSTRASTFSTRMRMRSASLASTNWSPFNIQNVGGDLVVTFAHRAPGSHDEDHGVGLGFVGVYDASGHLRLRLQRGSWFNAPWGIAAAPGDFGKFTHRLLIRNFGDGTMHGFNLFNGKHEGEMLDDTTGQPLSISGLWAISFGGGSVANNGPTNTLFFSAGPQ